MVGACFLVITDAFAEMCEVLRESLRLRFDLLCVLLYLWDTNSLPVRLICVVFHFICGTRTYFRCQSPDLSFIEMYAPVLSGLFPLQAARVVMLDVYHMSLVIYLHDDAF